MSCDPHPSCRAPERASLRVQAISGGELVLGDLRMPGLDLATVACSAAQSGGGGVPTATALLCVLVDGMPPQELRVRVRPGPPACVVLQPGHPWEEVMPSEKAFSAVAGPVPLSCQAHVIPTFGASTGQRATFLPSTMRSIRHRAQVHIHLWLLQYDCLPASADANILSIADRGPRPAWPASLSCRPSLRPCMTGGATGPGPARACSASWLLNALGWNRRAAAWPLMRQLG